MLTLSFLTRDATAADGTPKSTIKIDSSTPNGPALGAGDHFGISVANIGDLDGDGIPDIAVGAPDDDNGGMDRGAIHILFLNSEGTPKNTVEINSSTPNGPSLSDHDHFGSSVANLGDLNGDGVQDLAVGSWGDSSETGTVHVLFLEVAGTPRSTVEINANTPNGPAISAGDRFGSSVATLGDLDGDGVQDLAVGMYHDNFGGTGDGSGAVYILFFSPDNRPPNATEFDSDLSSRFLPFPVGLRSEFQVVDTLGGELSETTLTVPQLLTYRVEIPFDVENEFSGGITL